MPVGTSVCDWFVGGVPPEPDVDHVQPVSEQETMSSTVCSPAGPNQAAGVSPAQLKLLISDTEQLFPLAILTGICGHRFNTEPLTCIVRSGWMQTTNNNRWNHLAETRCSLFYS